MMNFGELGGEKNDRFDHWIKSRGWQNIQDNKTSNQNKQTDADSQDSKR